MIVVATGPHHTSVIKAAARSLEASGNAKPEERLQHMKKMDGFFLFESSIFDGKLGRSLEGKSWLG